MTIHAIPQKTESRAAYDVVARLRFECYQAHVDAGFDHDSAISFVIQDFMPGYDEAEDEEIYTFVLDKGDE